MTRTIEKTIYQFDELTDAAKEAARSWYREASAGDGMHEFIYEDAAKCGELMGIELAQKPVKLMGGGTRYDPTIYYSGFCSQGDGACFEGRYSFKADGPAAIRDHTGNSDAELARIADWLHELGESVSATCKHRGHYYHSGCMDIDVSFRDADGEELSLETMPQDISSEKEKACVQLLRDFADWIYDSLQKEYEYQNSDENVDETIRINEYEFDEDGKRYC